ncbi:cytidylyltransferase domain-containing protein [Clostridium diolis]|uniref:3-deoxy-manno-octulosonate cytidylyltransferase n=1 Tax=Clostridium diolis TaxID=223919 RepID=A0AAV3VVG4_9CLOT|nr:glycosyltransferase family protein [Clostridium diolis]QES75309.1 NTP transferase domain-containing protein [Clostridium diolis]GEA29287.1 3-deoxy-manno-octulosonate cytidylyltransferase [Clostridium diolis]
MKIACIVQARMGSTRLSGKVLKKICGKTVLEHDIDRLRRVENINEIVVATTNLEKDHVIIEEANKLGVKYFRGSEKDVLSRYYYAAKENNVDIIVRVTSDCPLIDSEVTEKIIQYYIDSNDKYDYVSNTIDRTYPRGLDTEVFSFKVLEKAFNEAKNMRDREHVTPYIWDNPNLFKLAQYKNDTDYSEFRWTLDTKEDFELINRIYSIFYSNKKNTFNMNDILELYEQYSDLNSINNTIKQKDIQ